MAPSDTATRDAQKEMEPEGLQGQWRPILFLASEHQGAEPPIDPGHIRAMTPRVGAFYQW